MDEKGRMGWVLKGRRRNGLGSVWLAIGLDVYTSMKLQNSRRSIFWPRQIVSVQSPYGREQSFEVVCLSVQTTCR